MGIQTLEYLEPPCHVQLTDVMWQQGTPSDIGVNHFSS